ncbi:heavy-metal-associated domain-containing protein [Croceibacterium sp. TMG7-5b_MA50]|uniref:heavy-metal-associated domain-containing protein n=1 Tax=Croceibacterium sp. TMG7-5b_MA50 TaxID=3121290 RepID=UPI003221483F
MAISIPPSLPLRLPALRPAAAALLLAGMAAGGAALWAQVAGDRGIRPVAATTDIEVRGIQVNVTGDNAEAARRAGWAEAQRLAWAKIGGPKLPDSQLDGLVTAIIVGQEQLGPRRYIATLGVVFDRARAGGLLGGGGARARSAPMLVLPVLVTGGTETVFEVRNPWQRAWAEFQTGASAVDYVRPTGSGWESLLLTAGQANRRSRAWWNAILDQFGAADVITPVAQLTHVYPGGPVEGRFTARHGPDNLVLGSFTLRAANSEQLPAMLAQAVERFDQLYTQALASGQLRPDPTLSLEEIDLSPEVRALIDAARQAEVDEAARIAAEQPLAPPTPVTPPSPVPGTEPAAPVASFTVQVTTPDPASIDAALGSVRGTPGVRQVTTPSIAIGGTSVLQVGYAGDLAALAAALRARGWTVTQGSNALAITR